MWKLSHAWRSHPDLAAISLCQEKLAPLGIQLANATRLESAQACKMHGMEIVDALASGRPHLADLSRVAKDLKWRERLPPFVKHYMTHGDQWHGIPVAIHRANCAWVNGAIAKRLGERVPADIPGLLGWLKNAGDITSRPLAVGAEPWQIGVLFESVALAVMGVDLYRRAFEGRDVAALRSAQMVSALDVMLQLRKFVDENALQLPWTDQLARVDRGDAALAVMGDWAGVAGFENVSRWAVPGTAGNFVFIADYFVPLASSPEDVNQVVADLLTQVDFQEEFSRIKGSLPANMDAWPRFEDSRWGILRCNGAVVPSLTFDQCVAVPSKQRILDTVAAHFLTRGSSVACADALAY